jgi:lipoprotein-anchoring transpeptidase ErfK/SrfK
MPRSALSESKIKAAKQPAKGRAKKVIRVNLALQIVEAYEGAERVFKFECVTGDEDNPTDRGQFAIWDRRHPWTSGTYGVKMDYALFFTKDGKALHQYHGPVPLRLLRSAKRSVSDWIGSKGCVRLREADAKALWNWAPKGTAVHVS